MTVALTIVVGFATGVMSALLGVGGGLVMVPYMVIVLGLSQHVAEGTSLLVIVPTAIVGVLIHSRNGFVRWRAAMMLAAGGVGGALIGARVGLSLDPEVLQKLFAVPVAIVAVRLIRDGIKVTRRAD